MAKTKNRLSRLSLPLINPKFAARDKEVFKLKRSPKTFEVFVKSDITLKDYQADTPPEDWQLLEKWAKPMIGKLVVFINPTMEGGGVAMMRPPLIHLLKLLGIDAHWYVMDGEIDPEIPNPFVFTKLMHNILQRRLAPEERINKIGKLLHMQWNKDNAEVLTKQNVVCNADIIVLDDPQPAPLKLYLSKVNSKAKFIWRSHIDTDIDLMSDPSTSQGEVASYLLNELEIKDVDAVIVHPVKKFIYPGMDKKTFFAPATIDPFDDMNRQLNDKELRAGLAFINHEISAQNKKFSVLGKFDDIQSKINSKRRQLVLVARFDEAKGMDKALGIGVLVREKMRNLGVSEAKLPQIIIIGNGSVDDPSGIPMYEKMMRLRRERYEKDKKDIIIMRLRHNYMAINALMSQAKKSIKKKNSQIIALQTSEAEGCETRITDWILHGVPVVISNRGGMPLQVIDGKSGLILDYDKPNFDIERGAEHICEMMTNRSKYLSLIGNTIKAAKKFNHREFTTTANTARLLRIFCKTISGAKVDKTWKISDLSES